MMETTGGDITAQNHSQPESENIEDGNNSPEKPCLYQTSPTATDSTTESNGTSDGSDNDTPEYNVLPWFLYLLLGGTVLGMALPKNPHLPSRAWQLLSNVVGYTYFLAWSLSFYPQVLLNRHRGTTRGLSVDFCVLNVLGYVCYTVYTTNFYWNDEVIGAYRDRGGEASTREITVQGNDVAFAIHAVLMASFTLYQVGTYDTFVKRPPSKKVYYAIFATSAFCSAYLLYTRISLGRVNLLGFLYVLGTIKIGITIAKYVPQALLNRSRKSTVGWNVYNVILDITGGILSLLQIVGDCAAMGDWTGITGNPAKISVALVTICFDLLFLVQHYVLYPIGRQSYSPLPAV